MKLTVVVDNMTVKQGLLVLEGGTLFGYKRNMAILVLDTGGIAHVLDA